MTETKACKVVWEKDHKLGWRMKVVGDCESLDAVLEAQNPARATKRQRTRYSSEQGA